MTAFEWFTNGLELTLKAMEIALLVAAFRRRPRE